MGCCVFAEWVYGALLGIQKGRSVEICNSFELVVTSVEGSPILDRDYFTEKEEQCKSVIIILVVGKLLLHGIPTCSSASFF